MILQRPDIIMLDEPLSKIDKGDIKDICLTISQLFKDKFLIIVSHDGWYGDFISLKLADGKLIRSS